MQQQENNSKNPRIIYRDAMDKIAEINRKIKVLPKEISSTLRFNPPGFKTPNNLGEPTKSKNEYEQEKLTIENNLNSFLLAHFAPKTKEEHEKNIDKLHEEYLMSKEEDLTKYQDRFLSKQSSQKNLDSINRPHSNNKEKFLKLCIGFYENYSDIKFQQLGKELENSAYKEKTQSKEAGKERD